MHMVTQVTNAMSHFPGEDVMLTQLLLDYDGNTNVQAKEVSVLRKLLSSGNIIYE